jgi:hypothetical protein
VIHAAIAGEDDRSHIVERTLRSVAVSHFAQYFATKKTNLLRWLAQSGDGVCWCSAAKRSEMHRDDLMNPDLLSELVLLGSASLIFFTLIVIVVTAFSRAAAF